MYLNSLELGFCDRDKQKIVVTVMKLWGFVIIQKLIAQLLFEPSIILIHNLNNALLEIDLQVGAVVIRLHSLILLAEDLQDEHHSADSFFARLRTSLGDVDGDVWENRKGWINFGSSV